MAPIVVLVVGVLAIGIVWLVPVGVAGTVRASAQSAADASALAAGEELRGQAMSILVDGPGAADRIPPMFLPARSAAEEYAERNGSQLTAFDRQGREFRVEVETDQQLEGRGAEGIGVSGTRGESSARARIEVDWRLPIPGSRSNPPLSDSQIASIAERNGFDPDDEDVAEDLEDSILHSTADCPGGPDVRNLNDRMHDAIIVLELMDSTITPPLSLRDGYRPPGCGGPSDDGFGLFSPENYGDTFRTTDSQQFAVAQRMTQAALCRPYPLSDPNLFVHQDSSICAGQTGNLTPSLVYGGDLRSIVRFEVRLIPDEGELG